MNESVEIDGVTYKVGDKIEFDQRRKRRPDEGRMTGEIRFGIYEDDEGYSSFEHVGFYVYYILQRDFLVYYEFEEKRSLVDIVRVFNGKLIEKE